MEPPGRQSSTSSTLRTVIPVKLRRPRKKGPTDSQNSVYSAGSPLVDPEANHSEEPISSSKPATSKIGTAPDNAGSNDLIVNRLDENLDDRDIVVKKKRSKKSKKIKSGDHTQDSDAGNESFYFDLDGGFDPDNEVAQPTHNDKIEFIPLDAPVSAQNESPPPSMLDILLLPSHVLLSQTTKRDVEGAPPSPTSSVASNIQFIDDDLVKPTVQRYFGGDEDTKGRLCSTCGKTGHISRFCKVLVCWTCGTRDDHESRHCPINITCWNCGRRGHPSNQCTEPRARRLCELCGSHQHVQNSCPGLWRQYVHLTTRDREDALIHRVSKIGLKMGSGGEGFISWEPECFVCGEPDHFGFDCSRLAPGLTNREPPAFSRHHADTGPWPFDEKSGHGKRISSSMSRAIDELRLSRKPSDTALYESVPALLPGRMGRKKSDREGLRRYELAELEMKDDEDDWFSKNASSSGKQRSRGRGGTPHKPAPNGKGDGYSREEDRIKGNTQETGQEREEREYLAHQSRSGGRYDEAEDHGITRRSRQGRDGDRNSRRDEKQLDGYSRPPPRTPDHRGARDRREDRVLSATGGASRRFDPKSYDAKVSISIRGTSPTTAVQRENGRLSLLDRTEGARRDAQRDPRRNSYERSGSSRSKGANSQNSRNGPQWNGGYSR